MRIGVEMLAIVVSILLAFGIDAWWARGQERRAVTEYQELLRVQMAANLLMLEREIASAEGAELSLGTAIRAISPNPDPISADSLWRLVRGGWGMTDQNVETSALESVLRLESFDPAAQPTLYRQMIDFRGKADRLGDNVDRFVVAKDRTSDYLRTVSPIPALVFDDADSGDAFPVPIDRLLRDPQLESLLKELRSRHTLRRVWAEGLAALADSITMSLAGGA